MNKVNYLLIGGIVLIILGGVILLNAFSGLTGYVVFEGVKNQTSYLIGVVLFVGGIVLLMARKKREL